MKFDQYIRLKDIALQNCVASGHEYPDPKGLSPIVLAYIGDVIFSSYIRLRLLPNSSHVRILHDLSSKMVSAVCQSTAMQQLNTELTEDEQKIYHRGRNAKSMVPKSASVHEYREATAFEALIGYLYLSDQIGRSEEIMEKAFKIIVATLQK